MKQRLIIQDLENFQEDLSFESSEVQGGLSIAKPEFELEAEAQLIAYPDKPIDGPIIKPYPLPVPLPHPCWFPPPPPPCHYHKPVKLTADAGELVIAEPLWCPVIL